MNKYLKYLLAALAGTATLCILLIVIASLLLNPNDYKPQIVQMVKEQKQRNLSLAGDIKLAFFPKLGLDLGQATLSEFRGDKEFASVESARLYLSWWPLLKQELVVDQVRIEGLRANLVRFKNGATNFDDLLKKEAEEDSKQLSFDIKSVLVEKSTLSYHDKMAGRQFSASEINLKTGRLANTIPTEAVAEFSLKSETPQIDAQIHLSTGLTFDLEAKHYGVKGLNLAITGEAAGISKLTAGLKGDLELDRTADTLLVENLSLAVAGKKGTDDIDCTLTVPRFQWLANKIASDAIALVAKIEPSEGGKSALNLTARIPSLAGDRQSFKASKLTVELNGKQPEGKYQGQLTSQLSGSLDDKQFALANLKGNLTASNKKMLAGALKLDINGSAQLDLKRESVALNLTSLLDESTIKLRAGAIPFSKPHLTLDLDIDRIDADRYLPKKSKKSEEQAEKPLDFNILKTLNAGGKVRIGSLKLYNLKTSNLRLDFKAGSGQLDVKPLAAELYGGTMNGSISLQAEGPRIIAQQTISGVNIGPLLQDGLDKDILEGRGSLNFDLRAAGGTVGEMKKSMQGKGNLNLRDGAVKGFNIAGKLREAKVMLGKLTGEKTQAADMQEKTDFSELTASFDIKQGVAHNKDLAAKSPLLRLSGNGDIDIGADMVNYLVRATVVASLEGQGGKELVSLKGLTVPVRIAGPMGATKVTLDFNALVGESVQQGIKTRVTDPLKEGIKGLFR
ncbi:AsmA family protein [Thiovibrio frasassiensis]|uniref:AsmA family protein n=1 Tax=Thiovibrio frasassiensis TaxID=2984131 RepID=A0A9X4MFD5_9BACT|nr:AsmA family protein [Thiovibrio frasassiensis]MDG4476519.1 AsmA family protein [Thiovibrio frasassiensis]